MTDFFFRYISVNYEQATDTLTHLPDFISKNIFEREILNKITDKTDRAKVRAYYTLIDINDSNLSESLLEERISAYPFIQQTTVYLLQPSTTEKEKSRLINILNKYDTIADSDMVQMYMDYGINRRKISVISFEPLYLEELPYFGNVSETIKTEIASIYRKTTLACNSLTQVEYDYIISKYKEKYGVSLCYYRLTEDITSQEKQKIQAIPKNYPEITINADDKYEKFDEEYDISILLPCVKYNNIIDMLSNEDMQIISGYYTKMTISPADDIYEFEIPGDDQITIYILRDDLSEEEKLRLETYNFAALGKHSAAFLNINNQVNYRDINEVSSWARESVERMSSLNLMTGANLYSFTPFDFITQEEVAQIINNIVSGMMIY
jgi:hypothetical protein